MLFVLFIGDIVSAAGDALGIGGDNKGLLDFAAPVAGAIPGVGPIASAAMGGLAKFGGSGGDPKAALSGAAQGVGAQQVRKSIQNQRQDSQRARELVNQAVGQTQGGMDIALRQHRRGQPLRQGFRQGAMNFFDPTNPFSTNVAAGGNMGFQGQQGQPSAARGAMNAQMNPRLPSPGQVRGGQGQPGGQQQGGGIRDRVDRILNQGFDPADGGRVTGGPSGGSGGGGGATMRERQGLDDRASPRQRME